MSQRKLKRILTTSNIPNKKVAQEPGIKKTERGGISFEPHPGNGATNSSSPEEGNSSISGKPPRSLPSPWGKPFVVIIAAWNCKKWIADCFETLADQTLSQEHWGVLVLDDASEDRMERICRRWKVEHIRVTKNRGKSALINLASILLPPETVLVELDADDGLDPRALAVIKDTWGIKANAVMIYTQYALCLPDLSRRARGHSRQAGNEILDAGYISHLKTYRAQTIKDIGFIDESIRKSTDKVLIYLLQELAEKTGNPIIFIDEVLYWYRRRAEGSITKMVQYDSTEATRKAFKRRENLSDDILCVFSASEGNDTGGPGIFWDRLLVQLGREESIRLVDDLRMADVIIGNIKVSSNLEHLRPWVIRLDGVHFNSRTNYKERNVGLAKSVNSAEGMVYQSMWGKAMADEYCGKSTGEVTIIPNGLDLPDTWAKRKKKDRKIILACSRWGDATYQRKFKRIEETIGAFTMSGLAEKGYDLLVLGQHYLDPKVHLKTKGVTLAGRVSPEQVHSYLSRAALFVHLSWLDCCPNGVVEALAAKVPVLYCAEGVQELVGEHAGRQVTDSPINHPCDTGKPPMLDLDEVAGLMSTMVEDIDWDSIEFPDVSMETCGKRYVEIIRRAYQKGPKILCAEERPENVTPVSASTEDMR